MAASYSSSVAPGTAANRKRQAEDYITFALQYQVPYLSPTVTHVCMYAQRLANSHASPNSVKNYLSGAKTWVGEHQGNIQAFFSPQLNQLVKGFVKNSLHVPQRAAPLAPHHLQTICNFLDTYQSVPLGIKPAILIGYSCFLRSSNILSPTISQWGGPHTLLAGDITLNYSGLSIYIRSTKTRSAREGISFDLPRSDNLKFCPVAAWERYLAVINPWALGPAFIHTNRRPITPREVVALMRLALQDSPDISAARVSMHSLRRGATHTAVDKGLPLEEIKKRGTWKSNSGIRPYLEPSPRSVTLPVSNLAL